jgi:hypothetical protein
VCAVLKFDPLNFLDFQKEWKDGRLLDFVKWRTKKQSRTGDVVQNVDNSPTLQGARKRKLRKTLPIASVRMVEIVGLNSTNIVR